MGAGHPYRHGGVEPVGYTGGPHVRDAVTVRRSTQSMSSTSPRTTPAMTTSEIRSRLSALTDEHAAAIAWGADAIPAYIDDLQREIEAVRAAYVGAAVTEIASFRAVLSGPQVG